MKLKIVLTCFSLVLMIFAHSVHDAMKGVVEARVAVEQVATAKAEADAAIEFAKAKEAQVAKVELEIEKMRAQAMLTAAERWNGSAPASIPPTGHQHDVRTRRG